MKLIKRLTFFSFIAIPVLTCLSSCIKSTREFEEEEAAKIEKYLSDNPSLHFELKSSGLYYLEVKTGTGLPVVTHDTAYVFYSIKFLDGTELGTNIGTDDTLSFAANEGYLIKGFDEGITYMKVGGESLFLIPSRLAYGATGDYYQIPGFTPLIFDVRLVRVKQGSGKK